jgi:predicted esterase
VQIQQEKTDSCLLKNLIHGKTFFRQSTGLIRLRNYLDNFYANRYLAFTDYWHYDDVSENCLGINVWTPGYKDNAKRPVLLWIHGGGYTSGNSIEHPEYHGENLSRQGNIVFCSLNHRLGPLGFSNLAGVGGEKFAASGNVGMLDIVAALEWIRDNISNFGGDPGNVTIMGQSGGGAKVCTLTAMPSAKGLFHKAVALSGNTLSGGAEGLLGETWVIYPERSRVIRHHRLTNCRICHGRTTMQLPTKPV